MLATSACGGVHPGAAAVVGSTEIPHEEVDVVASALCAINAADTAEGGGGAAVGSRGAREAALQVLVDSELSRQFAEDAGVEPDRGQVSAALRDSEQVVASLPEDQRDAFREAVRGFTEGQSVVVEAGRQALEERSDGAVDPDRAATVGQRLRAKYADSVEVEVDPRYGAFEKGVLTPGGTSLSVAASETARAGDAAEPAQDWIAGLPASQQCA
jgi:hypothetical protein